MYGQNLGGRPDAPGEPIFTKNVGAVGVEISPLPLKRHIAYTTACCYRTSRDLKRQFLIINFCCIIIAVFCVMFIRKTLRRPANQL